ncbi:MAG TPA: hypothetical protein VGQ99_02350 [Tepidisphaeraceae bacterium]|jgi:hypothetical protein|nr:hypothetical protein [Tepidisphaeraceae bacterium]
MAKSSTPPPNVAIASLDARKQSMFNLMAPGPGTPWEDRGSIGVIGAFFKTAFQSMFKPVQLLDSIRRPETGGDAFSFAIGCGLMWGLSAIVHGYLYYRKVLHLEQTTQGSTKVDQWFVSGQLFFILCAVAAVLAVIGALFFQKLGAKIYYAMVATEMTSKAPPILVVNIFGYCLGPSLVAPVPYIGPPLAVTWILIALIVGGVSRLKVSMKGAMIGALVSVFAMVGMFAGVWFVAAQLPPHAVTKEPPLIRGRR